MKASIEKRLTLDDLFGPDLDAEIEALNDRSVALFEELNRIYDQADLDAENPNREPSWFLTFQAKSVEIEAKIEAVNRSIIRCFDELKANIKRPLSSFFLIVPTRPTQGPETGKEKTGYRVVLFPSFWVRTAPVLSFLIGHREAILRNALEELGRTIHRVANFTRRAAIRCVSAIREAIVGVRRIIAGMASISPLFSMPHVLAAKLLSPHVLAAGGCAGAFILRI
jgi:hypothetical protein